LSVALVIAAAAPTVWVEWMGFAAAFCTTTAFVPQLLRVLRLKSARDISLKTFLLFSIGVFLWLVYGLYTGSKPVIASNVVTLGLSLSILYFKLKFDRHASKEMKL
jgi:MtN3 and saliva related transmembrane protein